ncbi:MAG: hypothetical protein ACEY3M_16955 [Wolbachia sp.]
MDPGKRMVSSQCPYDVIQVLLFLSSQCLTLGSRNFIKLVSIKVLCKIQRS